MGTAVLDVGKTNLKLVVFSGAGAVFQRSRPNASRPGPPYPHADVEAVWAFMTQALREAAAAHAIDTLVVTTHGAAHALIDDEGLVLPVMDYEFEGISAIAGAYRAIRPPFAETMTPAAITGLNGGAALHYQETVHPEAFARARHMVMYPQYYGWRLTGVARGETTMLGCHNDAWDPVAARPSSLARARGLDAALSPLAAAHEVLGPLRPEIAAATGLSPDTRVLAGIHDSNASILPHLLSLAPPFTVISTGTWVVILAVGGTTDRLDPAEDSFSNVDVAGRVLPTAKHMGGREFATILGNASPAADADDLAAVLASGAMALPAFAPAGGPFAGRTGRIAGPLPDRAGSRAALASLYEALVTDRQLGVLGAAAGPLVVEGSFAANEVFCGALAALRPGQPVMLARDTAGTAFGASLLAHWPKAEPRAPLAQAVPYGDAQALLRHRAAWREAVRAG